jgi:HEPN domain-containing protein
MNRTDFQELAKIRIEEAKVLLDNGYHAGSYYLAGYTVECALKACIAKLTKRYDFPPDRSAINNIYVHNLETLMRSAQLWQTFTADMKLDSKLQRYWTVVKAWSETQRYELNISGPMAHDMYEAITARKHGVLSWLKKHW